MLGPTGSGWSSNILIHHESPGHVGGSFAEVVPLHVTAEAMETFKANARLIAAAPELLAALKALLEVARSYIGVDDFDFEEVINADIVETINDAKAAIAKATGEGT